MDASIDDQIVEEMEKKLDTRIVIAKCQYINGAFVDVATALVPKEDIDRCVGGPPDEDWVFEPV
jgi:hypothetical protein